MGSSAFGSKKRPTGKAFRNSGLFSDIVDDLYKKVEQAFVTVEAAAAAAAAAGDLHDVCLVVTVAGAAGNITPLSGVAKTINGVAINTAGMRVLLAAQTAHSQNGPWVVAAGAWTRPTDFASGASVQSGNLFPISDKDNANPDTTWVVSVDTPAATFTVDSVGALGDITFTKSSILGFAAPGATGVATASAAGSSNAGARADHVHQSNTTPSSQAGGDAAAKGTSGEPARADHKHAMAATWTPAAHTASHSVGGSDPLAAHAVSRAMQPAMGIVDIVDTAPTLTAAQMVGAAGGIIKSTPTANRNVTTDTAANIITALTGADAGTTALFAIATTGSAAFTVTLVAGNSVTLVGNADVPANLGVKSGLWMVLVTSGSAVSMIRIG